MYLAQGKLTNLIKSDKTDYMRKGNMLKIHKKLLPATLYNERRDKKTGKPIDIDMLVFHCSAYPCEKLIHVFQETGVSAHFIIGLDGTITQLVKEDKRAWHAGVGTWGGVDDINSHSVGIELVHAQLGHTGAYPSQQIEALKELSKKIIKTYHILPHNVVAHSDIAPTRRYDPGRLFPWQVLAQEEIGLFPSGEQKLSPKQSVKDLLRQIGYSVENEPASLRAFIRHFMPQLIPDKENPLMDPYQFLLDYDKNLPSVLAHQPQANQTILNTLNQVAYLFNRSRQKATSFQK